MAGQTKTRTGGGSWTYLVGIVKNMSRSSRGLSAQIIQRPVDTSNHVKELGAQSASRHITWISLKLLFLVISMVHPWLKSKMKFDFVVLGRGITSAALYSVPLVRVEIYVGLI